VEDADSVSFPFSLSFRSLIETPVADQTVYVDRLIDIERQGKGQRSRQDRFEAHLLWSVLLSLSFHPSREAVPSYVVAYSRPDGAV
jgi:hypothetical protein